MKWRFPLPLFLVITKILVFLFFNAHSQNGVVTINPKPSTTPALRPGLVPGATNTPVLGIRLDKTTGANSLLQLVIQCSQDPTLIFSSVTFRPSLDPDFGGSETISAVGVMSGSPANTITFSLNENLGTGFTTNWFFIVADIRADATITEPLTLSFDGTNMTLSDNDPIASGSLSSIPYTIASTQIASLNNPTTNGVASSALVGNNQAIFGFSLTSNGNQTVTSVDIQLTSDPAGKLSNFSLVRSTDGNYSTTGNNSVVSTSSITVSSSSVHIVLTTPLSTSTTRNLFLVANVDPGTSAETPTIQASLDASDVGVNQGLTSGSATGREYAFLGATVGSLNSGANNVAASPLAGGSPGKAIFGFSLSSNGNQSVSELAVQFTATFDGRFTNFSLIESTDDDFGTTDDNTVYSTSSMTPVGNSLEIVPSTAISISSTARHFFLVADVATGVLNSTSSIQAALSASDITVNRGAVSNSATGNTYSFAGATATISELNNPATNHVASSPIAAGATDAALFGFTLQSNSVQKVTALNIAFVDLNNTVENLRLVESADADFATEADNTLLAASITAGSGNVMQVVPTVPIDVSTNRNLFVVGDINPAVATGLPPSVQLGLVPENVTVDFGTTTGETVFLGISYAFTDPTVIIGSLNASANNVAESPLDANSTDHAIFGFALSSNGAQTATAIHVQMNEDPDGIFSNFRLVSSADDDFATTDDNTIVATSTHMTVTSSEIQIVLPTGLELSTIKNLFLVADVDASVTGASGPIHASLSGGNLTLDRGSATGTATGPDYDFTPIKATIGSLNASANNVANSPILGGSTGTAIFGFSLSSDDVQSVSAITIQLSKDPAEIFSNFSLLESADTDFATDDDNSPIAVSGVDVASSSITFTLASLLDISTARNLFVVADVNSTVTNSSGPIQPSLSETGITVNQGIVASSSATGTDYSFTSLETTISSLNDATINNVATSPILGGETGQAIFGFSMSSSGSQSVSTIDVQFGKDPTGIFSNFMLIQSGDDDFATADDNTAVETTSVTLTGNALEITPPTAIDVSTAKNFFLVADVDPSVTSDGGRIQVSLSNTDFTVDLGNKGGSATGAAYNFTALTTTISSLNANENNVAASPLLGSATEEPIFGFSLSSNGTQTVSEINIQFSDDPTNILSNYVLIESGDDDYATIGDNTEVTLASQNLSGNALELVPSANIDVSTARNFFLVADVNTGITSSSGPIQASLTSADVTVNQGYTAGTATGTSYHFNIVTDVADRVAEQVKMFPNTADDVLNIVLPTPARRPTPFVIYDAFGHVIQEDTFRQGEGSKVIDTKDFAVGLYLLQIKIGNNMVVKKVLVMHK